MKNILIAGSSKNLGFYIKNSLSKSFNVISLSSKIKTIEKKNSFKCDLSNERITKSVLLKIKKKFHSLDAIIFSVGYSKKKNNNLKNLYEKFNLNFVTFFNLLENYCRIFKNKKTKFIVISSIVTEKTIIDAPSDYVISKAALKSYVHYKAKELAKYKIVINIISPGNILLPKNNWDKRLKKNKYSTKKYIKDNVPLNKFISGETISNACKFLIDNKNEVTGTNIVLDGGQIL
mgnify:CR=1 FL=1